MKVGILTYYGVFNHGAVLQANALKTVISDMGHDCDFITFNRNYDYIPQGQDKKYNISLKSVGLYAKYFANKGVANTIYNLKKHKILNEYRRMALPMGERYTDFSGDAVAIGSDEVFSLEIGINPFFYGHGLKAKCVFSYAGCFGPTTLEDTKRLHVEQLVSSGLLQMNAISTRDQNSANIVKSLTGRDATVVCDPVILYGYKQEMQEFVPKEKDYIILYSYENNLNSPEEVNAIRDYAKKHNLKVYATAYYHGWCDKNIQSTPNELLGWIKNAKMVVTDTFHGSVISLVCGTPMVVKLRGNQNKLGFLMEEYGLSNRIIEGFDQFAAVADASVDFDAVNQKIEERRGASMEFLKHALSLA